MKDKTAPLHYKVDDRRGEETNRCIIIYKGGSYMVIRKDDLLSTVPPYIHSVRVKEGKYIYPENAHAYNVIAHPLCVFNLKEIRYFINGFYRLISISYE